MLLEPARRWLGPALFAVLAAIGAATPFAPRQAVSAAENRVLAPAPRPPASWAAARALPRDVDRYMADHFAGRPRLVKLALDLDHRLGGAGAPKQAVAGQAGWWFLNDGLLRSTGAAADPEATAGFGRFVCDVAGQLRRDGAKVLVTLVPSPGEIYPEALPPWAGPPQRPTDYDRVLAAARACGAPTLDLRPPLIAAKAAGRMYRQTDSHWTTQGATVGYNAVVAALGRPDWALRLEATPWREAVTTDGDLPRMAGRAPQPEAVRIYAPFEDGEAPPRAPLAGVRYKAAAPYRVAGRADGPRVLVIGDSFTETYFAPLFREHAGSYVWLHLDDCAFDWRAVAQARPDYVILAPTERNARCPGGRPLNLPAAAGASAGR